MNVATVYLVCFIIPLVMLAWVVETDGVYDFNQIFLLLVSALGNIGEYALARSVTLTEALLAQKIAYIFGVFSPLIVFLMICDMCGAKVKRWLYYILYALQIGFYFIICTIGYNRLYYVTASIHIRNGIAFLTKTYGPCHVIYPIMMVGYLIAAIVVSAIYVRRNNDVNSLAVDITLCSYFACIAGYMSEKVVGMRINFLPVLQTILLFVVVSPFTRQKIYSVTGNRKYVLDMAENYGYVFFDKRLNYMGSNALAKSIFPEFSQWKVERRLPGSGGRFNTYLRQNLMKYINDNEVECSEEFFFEIDNESYKYTISRIINKAGTFKGYMIQLTHLKDDVSK